MNRIDARFVRDAQNVRDIEVGVDRAFAFTDQIGLIGLGTMQTETIFLRVDRDRGDSEFVSGTHHPYRDLAAIGDQQPMNPLQHPYISSDGSAAPFAS